MFNEGKIYINKLVETKSEDYNTLEKYNVSTTYEILFEPMFEQRYGEKPINRAMISSHETEWKVEPVFIQKAIQRKPFYQFSNLKNYIPILTSMKTFINHPNFLGNLTLQVSLPTGRTLGDVTPNEKLKMVESFFDYMEKKIRTNYMKEKGTPIFEGISMSELVNDYQIELSKVNANVRHIHEYVKSRSMRSQDWFIYDKAIGNQLEQSFIEFINKYINELEEKYEHVYLIRNERQVKVVEIDGVRGFMPDFLLYLQDENTTYQVFLEPKGDHLRLQDQWKEEFLLSLTKRDDVKVLTENDDVRLIGSKFYSETSKLKEEFREDFRNKL